MNIIFFGSFQHYSALILQSLIENPHIHVSGVITTPPQPYGRKQIITQTPVHLLADQHHIPVFTPPSLKNDRGDQLNFQRADMSSDSDDDASTAKLLVSEILKNIPNPDFFVTAGYGKILPQTWLDYPKLGSLNLHFSLLPNYRGANPAEWAIMCGETKTGITLMKMSSKLDGGDIIEQRETPITSNDNRETLYQKLYELGADELPEMLLRLSQRSQKHQFDCQQSLAPKPQPQTSPTPYAALLKRQDGFIPWPTIQKYLNKLKLEVTDFPSPHLQNAFKFAHKKENFIERLPLALATYPSLWTTVSTTKGDKRMKILDFKPFIVQIEGKSPTPFNQIKNQLTS